MEEVVIGQFVFNVFKDAKGFEDAVIVMTGNIGDPCAKQVAVLRKDQIENMIAGLEHVNKMFKEGSNVKA
jgi:hypothetical protein